MRRSDVASVPDVPNAPAEATAHARPRDRPLPRKGRDAGTLMTPTVRCAVSVVKEALDHDTKKTDETVTMRP